MVAVNPCLNNVSTSFSPSTIIMGSPFLIAFSNSGNRYGTGSMLITSQLPVDKWHDVIGEPTFADAILDRIVHNAHRLELSGESLRKTKSRNNQEQVA